MRQDAPECNRMHQDASECNRMRRDAAECARMHQDRTRMPPDAIEWTRMHQDVPMVEVLVAIRLLTTPGAAWMSKWPWGPFVEI